MSCPNMPCLECMMSCDITRCFIPEASEVYKLISQFSNGMLPFLRLLLQANSDERLSFCDLVQKDFYLDCKSRYQEDEKLSTKFLALFYAETWSLSLQYPQDCGYGSSKEVVAQYEKFIKPLHTGCVLIDSPSHFYDY